MYSEVTIVKDDSGSHAGFTEQGSSASQMTAANEIDAIARQPDCAGQAQSQNVQIFGYVFHATSFPNHGSTSKTQWFFLDEICMVIHLLDSCVKDFFFSKNPGTRMGTNDRIGNA